MEQQYNSRMNKILALSLAFIVGITTPLASTAQTVNAAVSVADATPVELGGMLSVATIVPEGWQNDLSLVSKLQLRDVNASLYATDHQIRGANDISGTLNDSTKKYPGADWVSNVLYRGDILRSDTFDGYVTKYNDGADAVVIQAGLNEIDVELVPVSDTVVTDNGHKRELSSWDEESGFASRVNLPGADRRSSLRLEGTRSYKTKLFVVGIDEGVLSKGSIYQPGRLLDYYSYLSYIGAEPSDENYAAYLEYVRIYLEMLKHLGYPDVWGDATQNSASDDSEDGPAQEDTPVEPVVEKTSRIIMIYLDGADLDEAAVLNLDTMLVTSINKSIGDHNHILILTGGSESAWPRDPIDLADFLYDQNGNPAPQLADTLGNTNQVWELYDGMMQLIAEGPDGYMTDPETLGSFLDTSKALYPDGDYYDLIMWDHGGGPEGGFGVDPRNPNDWSMTLYDMTNVIRESGIDFDLIAFDACLMSNAEISLALAPYTDYLLLSELVLPGKGYNTGYQNIINELYRNEEIGTVAYANSILNACIQSYRGSSDATLALVDAAQVRSKLTVAMNDFADELFEIVSSNDETTMDEILRVRKMFTFTEAQNAGAFSRDLIDIEDFMWQLSENPILQERVPAFVDACNRLRSAEYAAKLNYRMVAYDIDTMNKSQGSFPHGLSMYFPTTAKQTGSIVPGDENYVDQVINLVRAYTASDDLDSYGRSLAAYAIWLKVGRILGFDTSWRDKPSSADDEDLAEMILNDGGSASIQNLIEASGLDEIQVMNLINAQVADRFRKNEISVEVDPGTGEKSITIENIDPDQFTCVEVQLYVQDDLGQELVSLGANSLDYASNREEDVRSVTLALPKYDNKWLTIDGNVVSFYDSEIRELEDGSTFRIGIVPVAYWTQERPEGELSLKTAIEEHLVDVGVLEVGFAWDADQGCYEDTGSILFFRPDGDDSLAKSGRVLIENEIYELLAGFDDGNEAEALRSIGVIQKNQDTPMETASFETVTNAVDHACASGYNVVDGHGSKYYLSEINFPDEGGNPDPRNMDDYHDAYLDPTEAIVVPQASKNTAEWDDAWSGTYDDRTTKETGDAAETASQPEEITKQEDMPEPVEAIEAEPVMTIEAETPAKPEESTEPEAPAESEEPEGNDEPSEPEEAVVPDEVSEPVDDVPVSE